MNRLRVAVSLLVVLVPGAWAHTSSRDFYELDRNILRLAVYEMLHERDVPKLVVVDEAIELAKKYGSEHSGKFVNGLLDGLLKAHRFPGSLK